MPATMLAWNVKPHNPMPATGFAAGQQAYRNGKRLEQCATDEEARGWLAAETNGAQMYLRAMEAAGVPSGVSLAVLDDLTAPGWQHAKQDDCRSYDEWRYPNAY